MDENNLVLVFDDTSRNRLLKSLGISQNKKSELIDENNKVITSQDFEPIKFDDFGGILQGSKQAIKKEKLELVKFFASKK